jgi:hypothetical protein
MNRSRLIFFLIVSAAIIVVLAGIIMGQAGSNDSNNSSGSGQDKSPIAFTVAANPLLEDWISSAAQSFNGRRQQVGGRVIEVQVEVQDGLPVWSSGGVWSPADHPLVWIPEMTAAVEYANQTGLKFSIENPSLASTVMLWGAPSDRAQVIQTQFSQLDWNSVQQASTTPWDQMGGQAAWGRFFKPGFAQPGRYTSGMAAVLIAAAEFHNQPLLTAALLNDSAMADWLKPVFESVPSFATLGVHPAETLAVRGPSVADAALLPESEWLVNYRGLIDKVDAMIFEYPIYQFWFDFPFALWDDAEVSAQQRAAAQQFLTFLLTDDQQRRAANLGLRQADGVPAASTLFQQAGLLTTRPAGEIVELSLSRSEIVPFVNRNWTAF